MHSGGGLIICQFTSELPLLFGLCKRLLFAHSSHRERVCAFIFYPDNEPDSLESLPVGSVLNSHDFAVILDRKNRACPLSRWRDPESIRGSNS